MAVHHHHPYYPQDVDLSGHIYVENDLSVTALIAAFATGLALILSVVLLFVVRRVKPNLAATDVGLILWFVMCKCSRDSGTNLMLTGLSWDNTLVLRKLLCVQPFANCGVAESLCTVVERVCSV